MSFIEPVLRDAPHLVVRCLLRCGALAGSFVEEQRASDGRVEAFDRAGRGNGDATYRQGRAVPGRDRPFVADHEGAGLAEVGGGDGQGWRLSGSSATAAKRRRPRASASLTQPHRLDHGNAKHRACGRAQTPSGSTRLRCRRGQYPGGAKGLGRPDQRAQVAGILHSCAIISSGAFPPATPGGQTSPMLQTGGPAARQSLAATAYPRSSRRPLRSAQFSRRCPEPTRGIAPLAEEDRLEHQPAAHRLVQQVLASIATRPPESFAFPPNAARSCFTRGLARLVTSVVRIAESYAASRARVGRTRQRASVAGERGPNGAGTLFAR